MKKSKKKPKVKIDSYGRYSKWERGSRELPKILEFTETIRALEGNEFGMVLHITGGKGARLHYCIKHPPFIGSNGKVAPDFIGEYLVSSNDYRFFIGDSIWLPVEDKVGKWVISVEFEGNTVAEKTFEITM